VQLKETFFEDGLKTFPELSSVIELFEKAKTGIAFYGESKKIAGDRLKKLSTLTQFNQLIELLSVFKFLSESTEYVNLRSRPVSNHSILKQQERIHQIYQHVEEHFKETIDTHAIANKVNLSVPAFCRYFKKATKLTYTDFVNQYRINHAKKLLLQNRNVTESCFESGFENLSYFNRAFKKITGESPSEFKKKKNLEK
jgi:AraC-like DNA-binding protein